VRNRFIGSLCSLTLAGSCCAQIAYVRKNCLYVLPCTASGAPAKRAKPIRICKLNPRYTGELALAWNSAGEIELFRSFKLFGAVTPVRGAKIRRSADVESEFPPVHSPDGSVAVVFTSYPENKQKPNGPWFEDAYLVRTRDHFQVLLQRKADGNAVWSPNGKSFVLPYTSEEDATLTKLIAYPSLKTQYVLRGFPGGDNTFSPDGHTIALAASGPLEYRPTELYDAETGKKRPSAWASSGWQTSDVTSWSPDGRHYLEEYGAQDDRDRWTRHCVAIGDLTTGKSSEIPGTTMQRTPPTRRMAATSFGCLARRALSKGSPRRIRQSGKSSPKA
jgi:hypothetical protein